MKDLITRWDAAEVICNALRMPAPDYKKDPFHDSMSLAFAMAQQIPSAQQWIPVTERLPEEDKEVLITYKEKGDELDKPYLNIDITTYGQMYFGGNKVGNYKHWRSPFQYFNDNYEVTAWMPLPESFKGGE